ncbi:ATP-dependent Clp protease adapter ClpS [Tsukamurella soli]|uniref:ATP-dependent Clp protease adapter protein ClpS n=1 Tax=Tsukamurella soli TaxID=644556 RepID=A0ABP8J8V3_9ACTN
MSNRGEAVPGSGSGGPGGPKATPGSAALLERDEDQSTDKPWQTVVWDDPVNLMSYVTFVFRKLFGFSTSKAKELMMQVHTEGRAVVSTGDRDKVEGDVRKLHAAGLWATMQRDS